MDFGEFGIRSNIRYYGEESESDIYDDNDIVGLEFRGRKIRSDRNGCFVAINGERHYITNREAEEIKLEAVESYSDSW